MLTLLLLDEGSPITATIGLVKMAGGAALYWLAWRLLFRKGLPADRRLLGVGIACILTVIGFYYWPEPNEYGAISMREYVLVFLLWIPLLAAAIRFVYRRAHNALKK